MSNNEKDKKNQKNQKKSPNTALTPTRRKSQRTKAQCGGYA
jgi:hypothetical protein